MSLNARSLCLVAALVPALVAGQTGAAATPAPASPASAAVPDAPPLGAEEANEVELRALEERVSDLKEKVFRTRARLASLQERVTGAAVAAGARAVLVQRLEGSRFRLEAVAYALDGAPVFTRVDGGGDLQRQPELEVWSGRLAPGNHQLAVQLTYRRPGGGGAGERDALRLEVQSAYTFTVEPGTVSTIRIVGTDRGGVTAQPDDHPAVRYELEVRREEARAGGTPGAAEGAKR